MYFLTPLLLLAATAHAAVLTLHSSRLTVTSSTGEQLRSEPISTVHKGSPVELSNSDVLKITFQILEKDGGKGVQPHQTFLRFYDESSKEEGIQPIRVTNAGKGKFELNMAKPPASLPPTSTGPLTVTLLIGSPDYSPLAVELPNLIVPASHPAPVHPDEASFHPRPDIHHTFRAEQKLPHKVISAAFAGIVLAPWAALIGLWSQVSVRVPHLASTDVFPFIITLGAIEGLLFWYWVDLKLGQVLLYGSILGFVNIFTGKRALASIGRRRTGQK